MKSAITDVSKSDTGGGDMLTPADSVFHALRTSHTRSARSTDLIFGSGCGTQKFLRWQPDLLIHAKHCFVLALTSSIHSCIVPMGQLDPGA